MCDQYCALSLQPDHPFLASRAAATHAEEALRGANKKLEYLAHTDPLTKLLNRRNMLNEITTEIERFVKTGSPFSIICGSVASTRMTFGEVESQITMTFGVSTYCGLSEVSECIRRADKAMYQGKHQGRNCVVSDN
jgi:PleD family two-component response regulator